MNKLKPPAEFIAPDSFASYLESLSDVDQSSPLLGIDPSNEYAMSFLARHRTIRSPEAQHAGHLICFWLNGERPELAVQGTQEYADWKSTATSRNRILNLMEQLSEAVQLAQQCLSEHPYDSSRTNDSFPAYLLTGQTFREKNRIVHRLARYATYPVLFLDRKSGRVGLKQQPVNNSVALGEVLAAHGLITLLQADALQFLKQCKTPVCRRWFFAMRDRGEFCAQLCGQRFRDSLKETKQAREGARRKNAVYKNLPTGRRAALISNAK